MHLIKVIQIIPRISTYDEYTHKKTELLQPKSYRLRKTIVSVGCNKEFQ